MPSQHVPNVWILTTAPSAVTTKITLICLGETTQSLEVRKPIHILCLPTACSATSPNFHLPPCYEIPPLEVNISLDMANLNMINISSMNFCIWQHLDKHWNKSQLQHLASIPSVPCRTALQPHGHRHSTHYTFFLCRANRRYKFNLDTVFTYRSLCNGYRITYTNRFGNILLLFLWCQSARLVCQPLQPGTTQYTNLDDDVETAPIYRCKSKASQPIRPCKNHGLHIEHIPTWMESQCKQQTQSLVVPAQGSLVNTSKIQGKQKCM